MITARTVWGCLERLRALQLIGIPAGREQLHWDCYDRCAGARVRVRVRGESLGTGRRAGDYNSITTIAFGLVESVVGELEQKIALVRGFLESGYADRNRDDTRDFTSPLHVQLLEPGADLLGANGGLLQ